MSRLASAALVVLPLLTSLPSLAQDREGARPPGSLPAAEAAPAPGAPPGDTLTQALARRLSALKAIPLREPSLRVPGSTGNIPGAFRGGWGAVGVGVSYQGRTRFGNRADGAVGVSAGLGDPRRYWAVDIGMTILDLRPDAEGNGGFGRRGSFDLSVHRHLGGEAAVAFGVRNALNWGGTDFPASAYAVLSKVVRVRDSGRLPFSRLYLTAGLGDGGFLPEREIFAARARPLNPFGGIGARLHERATLFGEWTGQDFNLGVSLVPLPRLPLVVTTSLADLAGTAGDGARLTLGVGTSISFTR